jgi:hypothetical protein
MAFSIAKTKSMAVKRNDFLRSEIVADRQNIVQVQTFTVSNIWEVYMDNKISNFNKINWAWI